MIPFEYGEDLFAKGLCVDNVYGEFLVIKLFIKGDESSIHYIHCQYWAPHTYSDVVDLIFSAQWPLAI